MAVECFTPLSPISLLEPVNIIKSLGSSPGETENITDKQGEDEEKNESSGSIGKTVVKIVKEQSDFGGNGKDERKDNYINPYNGGGNPWKIGTPTRKTAEQNGLYQTLGNKTQTKYSQEKLLR
jgi:hypothetical protein